MITVLRNQWNHYILGKAAGSVKLRWYDIRCDDAMVQVKMAITESTSHDSGEYMCIRLTRQEADVVGLVVRQS